MPCSRLKLALVYVTSMTTYTDSSRLDPSLLETVDWTLYFPHPVLGLDEVGRGCLAGPVVAAGALFTPTPNPKLQVWYQSSSLILTDNKTKIEIEIEIEKKTNNDPKNEILNVTQKDTQNVTQTDIQVEYWDKLYEEFFNHWKQSLAPLSSYSKQHQELNWINASLTDSKKLSAQKRNFLVPLILSHYQVCIGLSNLSEINSINILQASLLAMKRAVLTHEQILNQPMGHLLIDGNQKIKDLARPQTTLIKGDLRCSLISAASIVAKVFRDDLMDFLSLKMPQYQFEKHKGYPSPLHKMILKNIGPSPLHRIHFKGVSEFK